MNSVKIELDNFSTTIGTSCQICDAFIPIIDIKDGYPRICEKCKKRLKKLLYESPKEGECADFWGEEYAEAKGLTEESET